MTFPLCSGFILFGAGFVVVFWLGLVLLRPFIRRLLPEEPGLNATLTMYLQYFGIIFGLLLGLLAVGAYQNHADAEKSVVTEAAGLAALYRDVSGYPDPYRTDLRTLVREYARSTIEDAWPQQRRGILPLPEAAAASPVVAIYARLSEYKEPSTRQPSGSSTCFSNRGASVSTASRPACPASCGTLWRSARWST
jgi:hypothetical protein